MFKYTIIFQEMNSEKARQIEAKGYIVEDACSSSITSLYPITKVHWVAKTDFCDEAVIATCPELGKTLFLDNEIQSSESDEAVYHECLVHPVIASTPSNIRSRVLVIGGGEGATVREVLKWPDVKHVTWIDIDDTLVNACREHLGWAPHVYSDARVEYKAMDIRDFLKSNSEPYNIIIIDLPDPDITSNFNDPTILQNMEFWNGIRKNLTSDGAFATHCGPVRKSPQQNGIAWVRQMSILADLPVSINGSYHTMIPSFQDDWGFVMSCEPVFNREDWSIETQFLTTRACDYIFRWP